MQDQTGPYKTIIQDRIKLYRTIQYLLGTHMKSPDHTETHKTIKDYTGPHKTIQDHTGPRKPHRNKLGECIYQYFIEYISLTHYWLTKHNIIIIIIVQLGLDFKLNTKIGLDTTHHKLLGHFQAY